MLVAVLALLALAAGIAWYALWPTPTEVERRWIESAGFDPRLAYPDRPTNEAGERLDALAARLGLTLDPSRPEWVLPARRGGDRLGDVRVDLTALLQGLRVAEPTVDPPPEGLARQLTEAEPILAAMVEILLGEETPRWWRDLDPGPGAPVPSWLDHLLLHRLLIASAAVAQHEGRTGVARRRLDAAWRLRETLDDDPVLLGRLVSIAELQDELALLRAIAGPLPGWDGRLAPTPLRAQMATALRLEGWHLLSTMRRHEIEDFLFGDQHPPLWLLRLQARRGADRIVTQNHLRAVWLENPGRTPSEVRDRVAEELGDGSSWNVFADTWQFSSLSAGEVWGRAARTELNQELTRRAIEVRALVRAGDAAALSELAGEHPSVVPGVTWICRIRPEAIEIRAAGDTEPLPTREALPLRFRLVRRRSA